MDGNGETGVGYLPDERTLDPAEWGQRGQLIASLHERFDGRDVRLGEVAAELGQPSLVIEKRVLCYTTNDMSGWVFVDCFAEYRDEHVPLAGHYAWKRDDDPLVRAVRHPAVDFESGLILTLHGKVLRWGLAGDSSNGRAWPTSNKRSQASCATSRQAIPLRHYDQSEAIRRAN